MKFPLDGGSPRTICDCYSGFGASWGSDNSIVFACEEVDGLWQVSASGGEPERITELDKAAGEVSHRLPHLLPDGRALLFTVMLHSIRDWSTAQIAVHSLETGERKVLIEVGSDARYTRSGHLVYAHDGTLMAVPFDLATLSVAGSAVRVLESVSQAIYTSGSLTETGAAQFAFSSSGSLAYISGPHFPEPETQPLWVDREGTEELIDIKPASYLGGRLSPDQKKVALWTSYKVPSVWLYDLERGTLSRETVEGFNTHPTWRPDSSGLVFASNRKGPANVFFKPFQTGSEAEHPFPNPLSQIPASFSPDGKELAFVQFTRESGYDLWVGSMESRSTRPFAQSRFRIKHPAFSPNGRWAYVTDETGRDQVYVEPYPGPGNREIVCPDGGYAPVWSRSGLMADVDPLAEAAVVDRGDEGAGIEPAVHTSLVLAQISVGDPIRPQSASVSLVPQIAAVVHEVGGP